MSAQTIEQEQAACDAIDAHEATLTHGTTVEVVDDPTSRSRPRFVGDRGIVIRQEGHTFYVRSEGLTLLVESRFLRATPFSLPRYGAMRAVGETFVAQGCSDLWVACQVTAITPEGVAVVTFAGELGLDGRLVWLPWPPFARFPSRDAAETALAIDVATRKTR